MRFVEVYSKSPSYAPSLNCASSAATLRQKGSFTKAVTNLDISFVSGHRRNHVLRGLSGAADVHLAVAVLDGAYESPTQKILYLRLRSEPPIHGASAECLGNALRVPSSLLPNHYESFPSQ